MATKRVVTAAVAASAITLLASVSASLVTMELAANTKPFSTKSRILGAFKVLFYGLCFLGISTKIDLVPLKEKGEEQRAIERAASSKQQTNKKQKSSQVSTLHTNTK